MLRFFFTWRVCLGGGLFINFITDTSSTYSIQDQGWNIDTQQISDMVAPIRSPSEPLLLGNVIPDSSPGGLVALAIPVDGSSSDSKFAIQTPPKQGSDIANQDGILVQGGDSGSGCPSSDNTRSTSYPRSSRKKIRARNDKKMCPKNFLLPRPPPPKSPNGGEEGGEQDRRTRPQLSLPKEDEQKKNSGDSGGRNGDRDPSEPPAIMIPPDDSKLPYLFMPEENRPKRNPELCTDPMHPVPVCGRPSDTYPLPHTYPNNQFNIDPCYPCMKIFSIILFPFSLFSNLFFFFIFTKYFSIVSIGGFLFG